MQDGSGLRWTDQGPIGSNASQDRLQDESLAGRIRPPHNETGHRRTNQAPAGRIRALQVGSGARMTDKALQYESWPAEQTRAPLDKHVPRKTN